MPAALSQTEREALDQFARQHGRTWKAELRQQWMKASAGEILQWLRNVSYFGPAGLEKYQPGEQK